MSIRTDLISQITTNISTYTAFKVASELPFDSGGNPLYFKNKKTVYVDKEQENKIQLYRTLNQGDVYNTETIVNAYLSVDAKNEPSDIQNVINAILDSRSVVTETQLNEVNVETEIEDDIITYTFEYNIIKIV